MEASRSQEAVPPGKLTKGLQFLEWLSDLLPDVNPPKKTAVASNETIQQKERVDFDASSSESESNNELEEGEIFEDLSKECTDEACANERSDQGVLCDESLPVKKRRVDFKEPSRAEEERLEEQKETPDERSFRCRFCDRRYDNKHALGGHQKLHKEQRKLDNIKKAMTGMNGDTSEFERYLLWREQQDDLDGPASSKAKKPDTSQEDIFDKNGIDLTLRLWFR